MESNSVSVILGVTNKLGTRIALLEGVYFFKQVFYGPNWTTNVLLPVNQNSNRTKFVVVDFLKVLRFSFPVSVVVKN